MDNFKRIRNPTNPHTYIYISQKEIDEDMNAQTDEIITMDEYIQHLHRIIDGKNGIINKKDIEIKNLVRDGETYHKVAKDESTRLQGEVSNLKYNFEEEKKFTGNLCCIIEEKDKEIKNQSEQLDQLLDVIKGKDEATKELKEENKKLKETIFRKEERINELDNFVTRKDREIKSNWSDLHRLRIEQRTSSEENRNLSDQVDQLLDVIRGKDDAIQIFEKTIEGKDELIKSLERTIKSICETHNKWVLSVTKMK